MYVCTIQVSAKIYYIHFFHHNKAFHNISIKKRLKL